MPPLNAKRKAFATEIRSVCLSAVFLASHFHRYEHSHKKYDFEENYRLSAIIDKTD